MQAIGVAYSEPLRTEAALTTAPDWYRGIDPTRDVVPTGGTWAEELGSAAEDYLSVVCGLLSNQLVGAWSRAVAARPGEYRPEQWGPRDESLGPLDRLLLRTGMAHSLFQGELRRVNWWSTSAVMQAGAVSLPTAAR